MIVFTLQKNCIHWILFSRNHINLLKNGFIHLFTKWLCSFTQKMYSLISIVHYKHLLHSRQCYALRTVFRTVLFTLKIIIRSENATRILLFTQEWSKKMNIHSKIFLTRQILFTKIIVINSKQNSLKTTFTQSSAIHSVFGTHI